MQFTKLTNAFGTITLLLATLSGFMVSLGCAPGAVDFTATCAIPWLPLSALPIVTTAFAVLTFTQKLMRPGGVLHSLFGSTAVVNKTGEPGTVTPAQVAVKTGPTLY